LFPKGVFRIPATARTRELTDPRAMRALAHPVRIAILQFVAESGNATATECANEVGESPQSCSYHLRALAKYGFVQHVDSSDGRENRWAMVDEALTFASDTEGSRAQRAATKLLQESVLDRDERIVEDYRRHEHELPEEWRRAALFSSGSILVTAGELEELAQKLRPLFAEYERRGRRGPEGARRVHVALRAVPRIERKQKR
jgi:predicted ArsR family transcriptional regulator